MSGLISLQQCISLLQVLRFEYCIFNVNYCKCHSYCTNRKIICCSRNLVLHDRIANTAVNRCKEPFRSIVCGNNPEALAAFLDLPVDPVKLITLTFSPFPSSYAILSMYVTCLSRLYSTSNCLR